jgi:diamine N-acetyltransferase
MPARLPEMIWLKLLVCNKLLFPLSIVYLIQRKLMTNLKIKKVTLNDINQLQNIARQTFYETFIAVNTEENVNKYLDESFSEAKLTAELNDRNSEFYFATINDNIIGYLKVNFGPSQTELKDDKAMEIERIYVIREFHGKKAGQLLFEKAVEIAHQKKAEYIWLGVWEKNIRALTFYRKNGFYEFDRHIFKLGDEKQTDLMMKIELNEIKVPA